jgi:hypothetical protein
MSDGPDLRREFVGIMFALAVGEVGLQVAALVQAGRPYHYLPAYSHLFLALFVIAASWVGWSRTQVPGAKKDVHELFELPFVVLLLDTAMVVTYFILVRTVDFSDGKNRIDSAADVALWHVVIFGLYVLWDLVTKVAMYERANRGIGWIRGLFAERESQLRLLRITPTVICFVLSWWLWRAFAGAKDEYLLTADFALLSMVLLFRALKSLIPSIWQSAADIKARRPRRLVYRSAWTGVLIAGLLYGSLTTVYSLPLPLPGWIINEIRMEAVMDEPPPSSGPSVPASVQGDVPATSAQAPRAPADTDLKQHRKSAASPQ